VSKAPWELVPHQRRQNYRASSAVGVATARNILGSGKARIGLREAEKGWIIGGRGLRVDVAMLDGAKRWRWKNRHVRLIARATLPTAPHLIGR
jgi:hypothetical protein